MMLKIIVPINNIVMETIIPTLINFIAYNTTPIVPIINIIKAIIERANVILFIFIFYTTINNFYYFFTNFLSSHILIFFHHQMLYTAHPNIPLTFSLIFHSIFFQNSRRTACSQHPRMVTKLCKPKLCFSPNLRNQIAV